MDTVIFGVSSGIAAYKAISIVGSLRKKGFDVIVIMTEHAKRMIAEKEFEKASGNKVASVLFPKDFDYKRVLEERKVEHITLAERASVIVIAPATANIIAKIANGIGDDLLTTTVLASKAPVLLCPSMNVNMWNNEITQENVRKSMEKGMFFVEPEKGMLACGYEGRGRLADIGRIEDEIIKLAERRNELKGRRIIVTAGGTEEDIDDVRVITNKSSGKMGIAIAEECVKRGAEVILIRGRTDIEPMVLLNNIRIRTAKEMMEEIKRRIAESDIIIHAAAVSDFSAVKKEGKIKSGRKMMLELVPNVKIIDKIKEWKRDVFLVGFKAEHNVDESELRKNAEETLRKAGADMIIANDVGKNDVFGSEHNEVIIIDDKGKSKKVKKTEKRVIAERIVDEIAERLK